MNAIPPVKATAKNVYELFRNKYQIDFYQREYKWQRKQIEELINDLTNKFKEYYKEEHVSSKEISSYAPYFLGSVILSNKNNDTFIIDGQQRMTSLTLLLIFLRNLLNNVVKDKTNLPELSELIYSNRLGEVRFTIDVDERNTVMLKLFNGREDVQAGDNAPDSVVNIIDRYADIQDLFPEELRSEKELIFFTYWLIEKVQIIEIVAYSDEEAYTIFETMNDRGLNLTPVDMLKGFILANINDEDMRAEAATVWRDTMNMLRNQIGDNADHEFFRDFFRAQYSTKTQSGGNPKPQDFDRMGPEFHRWFRESVNTLNLNSSDDFYNFVKENIVFYAAQYSLIHKTSRNMFKGYERVCYTSFAEMPHHKIIMLSTIALDDNKETIRKKISTVSTFLEIFLMKRAWAGINTTDTAYRYTAVGVMVRLRRATLSQIASIGLNIILKDPELKNFDGTMIMTNQNKRRIYRILARITDHLQIQNSHPSIYENLFQSGKQGYEIEHILANNNIPVEQLGFESQQTFETQRNEIGNLLLLPKTFNISYSNKPYQQKIATPAYPSQNMLAASLSPHLYENGELKHQPALNKYVKQYNIKLQPYETFTRESIQQRTQLYAQILKTLYAPETIYKTAELTADDIDERFLEKLNMDELFQQEKQETSKTEKKISTHDNSSNGKKNHAHYPYSLKDIIDAGFIEPNTKIFSTEAKYPAEATILENGEIYFNSQTYRNLSPAGKAVKKYHKAEKSLSTAGWDFWATKNPDGSFKRLAQWREEYMRSLS